MLRTAGFWNEEVSVLFPDNDGAVNVKHGSPGRRLKAAERRSPPTDALGWLAGAGGIALPGVGPVIAAGPLMTALSARAQEGGSQGVVDALTEVGVPAARARGYEAQLRQGNILISVHSPSPDKRDCARKIFDTAAAVSVRCTSGRERTGREIQHAS